MNHHRYKVYYEFNEQMKAHPLRSEKSNEEITDALNRMNFELSVILGDEGAQISTSQISPNAIILTIETNRTDQEVTLSMKFALNGLDLFATKL